jgi:biotin transport system substrate-specific component
LNPELHPRNKDLQAGTLEGVVLSEELPVPLTSEAIPAATPATWLRAAGIVLAGSAVVAVCAHIALPLYFTPIPLTLQTFAVLLLGLLLSPRLAAATLAVYLAEGALGLPVFAPVPVIPGGMAHLLGPTGGYLLAYPSAAALISYLWRRVSLRRTGRSFAGAALSAAAGNLVILGCGGLWLAALTHASAESALSLAVFPFLSGDALKIAAAAALAAGFQRFRRQAT